MHKRNRPDRAGSPGVGALVGQRRDRMLAPGGGDPHPVMHGERRKEVKRWRFYHGDPLKS
jgi:hypothetical protein